MASGSNYLTTYYAKRIVGDTAAVDAAKALLQTGDNITTHSWILIRSNRLTDKYGIRYKYDSSNTNDKIEFYGGYQVSNADTPTAWVQLDTGDTYFLGKVGIGYDPNTSGNDYKLYVDGTSYFNEDIITAGSITNNGRYLYIYTETSTADNLDSYIRFAVKDTTTGQTQNKGWIRVFNTHSADNNGMNMVIYSAGNVFIGGGESPKNLYDILTTSTSENLYATADSSIFLEAGANTIAKRKGIQISSAGHILPVEAEAANNNAQDIGASGQVWANMYATTFHGALDGNAATATTASSCSGNSATATTATYTNLLNINNRAPIKGDSHLEFQQFSGTGSTGWNNSNPTNDWYHHIRMNHGNKSGYFVDLAFCFNAENNFVRRVAGGSDKGWKRLWTQGNSVTNAVWNDLAESRKSESREPGYVITPSGAKTTKRLEPGCRITSDTWGFALGDENDETKMPVAISGRVLAYPARPREEYHLGDCVCSAPDGKVDIMTRQEIRDWPDCIIGIVNEIPDYEEWGSDKKDNTGRGKIKVNDRIWIDIK